MLGMMSQETTRFRISASVGDLKIQRMLMVTSISLSFPGWFNRIINNNFCLNGDINLFMQVKTFYTFD